MDSSILSGLLGGITALVVTSYISKNIRDSSIDGELKFGSFLIVLAWAFFGFSILAFSAFFYDNDVWKKKSEFFSVAGLWIVFAIAAFASFAEYFKTHGSFDDSGIEFYTPWSGKKKESWNDLLSVEFNSSANWYVLTFKSGVKIRLSNLLSGHGKVLDLLYEKGYDF